MTGSSDKTLICPRCSQASLASTVADPPLCPACGTVLRRSDPAPGQSKPGLSLGAPELDEDELTPDLARPDAPPLKVSRLGALSTTVFSSLRGPRRGQYALGSGQGRSGGLILAALVLSLVLLVGWRVWRAPFYSSPPALTSGNAPAAQLAAVSPESPKPPEASQKSEHQAAVNPSVTTWIKHPLSPPDPKLTLVEQWRADRERARMLEAERLRDAPRIPTESEGNRTMLIARSRRLSEEREQLLERIDRQACEVFRQDPGNVDAAEMTFKKFEVEGDYVQAIRACDLLRNVLTPPAADRAELLREVLMSYKSCEPNIPYGQNPIWRDEVEARARDAALPSERALPQVKVALESGSFVIELFEEDVPNAVANFVSLTEKGFYNGKWIGKDPARPLFHGGQTDPTRDRDDNAGHRIPWEQSRRNSHDTFDGHVAMVTTKDHNGASSLFQIVDGDQPFEDQGALLIGRVVEGMEVARAIVKNEKMTASVIRKRPHPYAPRILPQERGTPESEAPIRMPSSSRPPESERWLAEWTRLLTLETDRTRAELSLRAAKAEDRERWIAKLNSLSEQRDQLTEQVHSEAPAVFRLDRNNIQAARLSYRRLFDERDFVEAIRACDAVRDTYLLWSQLELKEDVVNVMKACRRQIATAEDPVWQEELAARARENALPPNQALPRVKISLERGAFIVELFEDETPNTVANFINLVEKGFYDGKHFWGAAGPYALIGGDNAEGFKNLGNAGYRIPFEHAGRRTRHNYEGTIGMYVSGKDFTGSSVFYVSMDANPSFDARGLPFGRVVEGMEVVQAIQKDDKMTATVIRKRNHPYVPRTLPLDPNKSAPAAGNDASPTPPPESVPAKSFLADRLAAEWALQNGGVVSTFSPGSPPKDAASVDQLPREDFHLNVVNLGRVSPSRPISKEGWRRLQQSNIQGLAIPPLPMSLDEVKELGRCSSLTTLYLNGTAISNEDLKLLSPLSELTSLRLGATQVDGRGLVHLGAFRKLRSLYLDGLNIRDDDLTAVQSLLLSNLSLADTLITDEGLAAIKALPLGSLHLDGTRITDDGLRGVRDTLTWLTLARTEITDRALEELDRLPALIRLDVTATKVTEDGARGYQNRHPKCRVVFHP